MQFFDLLAALALFAVFTAADEHGNVLSNGTHFFDESLNQTLQHFGCGTHHASASDHFNQTIHNLYHSNAEKHSTRNTRRTTRQAAASSYTVPTPFTVQTFFHVITSTDNSATITQAMVNKQINELNSAYNPYGVKFNLVNTSWTVNNAWSVAAGNDMNTAKQALRVGTYADLNIFFHADFSGGELGICTLPSQVPAGSPASVYNLDGCDVNANTMPGGNFAGYNMGKTAVHETGHWLGLLHTFNNYSCTGQGDYVSDTAFESTSTSGCPAKKNSCPSVHTTPDPIHNYMDYSTDACYSQFTAGQVSRIGSMWSTYRSMFA